jgi:hypothetical protein
MLEIFRRHQQHLLNFSSFYGTWESQQHSCQQGQQESASLHIIFLFRPREILLSIRLHNTVLFLQKFGCVCSNMKGTLHRGVVVSVAVSVSIWWYYMKIYASHFPCTRSQFGCQLYLGNKPLHGFILVSVGRIFLDSPWMRYKHSNSDSVQSTMMGTLLLKNVAFRQYLGIIHTRDSLQLHTLHKEWKFGCHQSIMKGTLLAGQTTYILS